MAIKVQYEVIHQAASDCTSTLNFLKESFGDLKKQLTPLTETWTGSAKTEYENLQREWDKGFEELTQLLNQIAVALPQIADGYQQTEGDVTKLMGNR
ncbi:WXG100 family type VII secretion target [Amycolatopsis anabasis]|uniref:WXG100 family type VII secretion target n=1 Tax=Amycolatopsis anabasis TaxID=1840409 RepID=UPI00131D202A|nr:WXG100 family type VII secretion target [Amycolatopsis anabasis]